MLIYFLHSMQAGKAHQWLTRNSVGCSTQSETLNKAIQERQKAHFKWESRKSRFQPEAH